MTARDARADGSDRGQELRIALVMTGGVSLCVWMGGVAREVDRLLERESAYGVLLDGLETDPRLDIVAGTSAGGLNGALLATARAFGADVKGLRDLWLRTGSLEDLLQLPGTRAPTSLLRGDGYFLPQVREALGGLAGGRTAGTEPPELFITGTLLYGRPTGVPDDLGTVVKDADHHAEFHFRPKDFGRDGVLDQLALAARCTASFPGAFEPCFVPIGTSGEPSAAHVDMEGVANFAESRWVVDGGVLLNKPIKPALKAIFAKPAEGQVRRVMLYVIPEAAPEPPLEDHFEHPPPFVGTLVAGSFTIPSNQSISAELDAILEQNARVDAIRQRRALAAGLGPGEVEQLAQSVYPGYRAVVADLIATWIVGLVADGAARVRDEAGDTPLWDAPRLRAALVAHLRQMPPSQFPAEGTTADTAAWFTTYDTVTRAGSVLLDTLRVALGLASMQSGDLRGRIAKLRGQVHEVLRQARLRRAEEELTPAGRRALAVKALAELRSGDLAAWAQGAVAECFGTPENWLGSVRELAGLLDPAAALLAEARESAAPAQAGSYRRAERLATGLRAASRDDALRRLFALEVVELAFGDEPPALDQSVELIQVSADGPNGLDGRTRPEEKLDGLQLGHFGAFYEKSWRANDWLWGRVDAATRLTQTLLEPFRLRQLGFTRDEALALVQRAALGDSPPDVLRSRFDASRADMERELQFLAAEKDAVSDAPLPRSLPSCALAVARRIQLEAALEELPELAETVRQDAEEPVGEPWASLPAGVALSPDEAISVFAANQVGRETIAGDAGSRRFTRTTYRAASVLLEILTGPGSGIHAHGVGRFALRPLAAIARVVLRVSLALRRR
jgi:patatin-related protein